MKSAIKSAMKSCQLGIFILLLMVLVLGSCATKTTFEDETEEYDYALHYALNNSNESAISSLYFKITQAECFLPTNLSFIQDAASEIPGMPKLLSQWTDYMNLYSMQWFENLRSYLNNLASSMVFTDPVATVRQSEDSASVAFETAYREEIKTYIRQNLKDIDLSKWEELTSQYKAWVETRKVLFGEENVQLEDIDILEELATYICDLYFTSLKSSEVLLRTTPDPNADKTVSKVFGLNQ